MSFSTIWSTVKLAAFCRGGNSLKLSSHCVNDRLRGVLIWDVLDEPVVVLDAVLAGLERIRAQIEELGDAHLRQWRTPDLESLGVLFGEHDLVLLEAQRHQVAVVAPVDEAFAGAFLLARQEWQQVEAIDMDLERRVADLVALLQFRDDVRLAGGRRKRRQEIRQRPDLVDDLVPA